MTSCNSKKIYEYNGFTLQKTTMLDNKTSSWAIIDCSLDKNSKEITIPESFKNKPISDIWTDFDNEQMRYVGVFEKRPYLEVVNFSNSLEEIGPFSFSYCGIRKVSFPDSIIYIESGAFMRCESLREVVIPESNREYYCAFPWCDNINTFTTPIIGFNRLSKYFVGLVVTETEVAEDLPSQLRTVNIKGGDKVIPQMFCYNFSQITTVNILSPITEIESLAFYGCNNIKEFTYVGTKAEWNSIKLSSSWNSDSSITKVKCSDGTVYLS